MNIFPVISEVTTVITKSVNEFRIVSYQGDYRSREATGFTFSLPKNKFGEKCGKVLMAPQAISQ